jgi:uncharacterized protein (DUF1015 family)
VPILRAFRALRYDLGTAGDLSAVICPPYDVITPAERQRLLARHADNAVRLELPVSLARVPASGAGSADGDPYEAAAATLREWRRRGVLRCDERPAVYGYEQSFRLPGDRGRVQRGFFARLRLEPLGTGVRPHERTLSAPKEDRLRLLRATATNLSPVVVLPGARDGRIGAILARIALGAPDEEATDDAGVRHRVWVVRDGSAEADALVAAAGAAPLTIADGHHRYETALRYRDERREHRGGARPHGEAPEDDAMVLVLDPGTEDSDEPLILPTHRIVHGAAGLAARLLASAERVATLEVRPRGDVVAGFSPPFSVGRGHMGVVTAEAAYVLERRPAAEEALFEPSTAAVLRALDVALVEAILPASASVSYTHDAAEAAAAVASGEAVAAVLVPPTPLAAVLAVADAGEVMPQKSTYFFPKVATGLVMNPLE